MNRKAGYRSNGQQRVVQTTSDGTVGVMERRVIVTPDTFVRPDGEVGVAGAKALRRFLGITL